jgi:hypothetical protein
MSNSNKSNKSNDKPLSVKDMFNLEFAGYTLLVSIPVTFFFNIVLNHKKLGDMVSLFFLTAFLTAATLYYMLRDKKQTIGMLGNKSALIFVAFLAISILVLMVRRMLQEDIYTLNGAVFFTLIILILIIVYNFVQILMGVS